MSDRDPEHRTGRRELFRIVAAHVLAAPALGAISCGPPPPPDWEVFALRAATWFLPEDLDDARAIGARWLDRVGRAREDLETELAPTFALLEEVVPAEAPDRVEATIAADFDFDGDGDGVRVVEGWSLGATEVHFAALVELFGL